MEPKAIPFEQIVRDAWYNYDHTRPIQKIEDISAKVSTNHVYRIRLASKHFVIAKLSFFGNFEHFKEDHKIINALSNNLPAPYENFLARALIHRDKLFVYRYQKDGLDIWVIFYRPIRIKKKLPRRLDEATIVSMAKEIAHFHEACASVVSTLPNSSKSTLTDVVDLIRLLQKPDDPLMIGDQRDHVLAECDTYLKFYISYQKYGIQAIPVFIDWNIGNFSVTSSMRFFSRWDYDWFRMSSRMLDFYFFSRIVSNVGDRTVFTYNANTLMEDRFMLFLKSYHEVSPLKEYEIDMMPYAYQFFLLNYVIKYGSYFFSQPYAKKLKDEALSIHLPSIKKSIDTNKIKNLVGI